MITFECIDKRSLGKLWFLRVQESELLHMVLNPYNKLEVWQIGETLSSRHLTGFFNFY